MKNLFIAISILVFISVTVFVMSDNSSKKIRRVKFTNEKVVVRNANTQIDSKVIEVNSAKTAIKNENIEQNTVKITNLETKTVKNNSSIEGLTFRNDNNYNYDSGDNNYNIDNYNKQRQKLDSVENQLKNPPPKPKISHDNFKNQYDEFRRQNKMPEIPDRYTDKNIDWNTWKSNFINRILDDSVYIKALDEYGLGAWFYYSFYVNSDGSITDVKVVSMHLDKKDKEQVTKLIKSYSYKPITRFPAHTKKKSVKVDAAVMLGTTEKRSKPSDFNENEKIRLKY